MLNTFASTVLVVALLSTLAATPTLATAQTRRDTKMQSHAVTGENEPLSENLQANQNLRADILKLVADVKAGHDVVRTPRPQIQSPQRNNLSKSAKIAIGVGIAVAVVVVILVSQRCSNEPGGC